MHFHTPLYLAAALLIGTASMASASGSYAHIRDQRSVSGPAQGMAFDCGPGNYDCIAPIMNGGPYCDGVGMGTDGRMGTERIAPRPLINQSPFSCDPMN